MANKWDTMMKRLDELTSETLVNQQNPSTDTGTSKLSDDLKRQYRLGGNTMLAGEYFDHQNANKNINPTLTKLQKVVEGNKAKNIPADNQPAATVVFQRLADSKTQGIIGVYEGGVKSNKITLIPGTAWHAKKLKDAASATGVVETPSKYGEGTDKEYIKMPIGSDYFADTLNEIKQEAGEYHEMNQSSKRKNFTITETEWQNYNKTGQWWNQRKFDDKKTGPKPKSSFATSSTSKFTGTKSGKKGKK